MLRSASLLATAVVAMLALPGPAFTQAPQTPAQPPPAAAPDGNSGLGPQTTHPSQVDKGQNMILPSAGSAGRSAAPTMVYDCKERPHECTTPVTPADKATAPAQSTPPATAPKP
ncbi:hypothetical protein [Bosea sp. BK604]|uniref:hypothetical protein n=1 Tax=Bosea sp. BK604 TaxID=2512180 RepID=UPI00104C5B93|nr:hypothetical protein [Bosea sp. BK604]TCR66225.1 hypothetical protein EV560_104103 [Bosea sp. BK604]